MRRRSMIKLGFQSVDAVRQRDRVAGEILEDIAAAKSVWASPSLTEGGVDKAAK